ncbi:VOC family protein [Nakamurella sp. GG22]
MTVPVPDLDAGLGFYGVRLGHRVVWRNDDVGQAGLLLPDGESELVLSTRQPYEPNWLVSSADDAADSIRAAGGTVIVEPFDIPVGRVTVVADPFGNRLVLVDLSAGRYSTDESKAADNRQPDRAYAEPEGDRSAADRPNDGRPAG